MSARVRGTAALLALAAAAGAALAQVALPPSADLADVGVSEQLDAPVPLDLRFTDERGRAVTLGSYFGSGRPVLLALVYYECPMLCTLVLDGLVEGLRGLDWTPGREFEIVTVSIDPRETTPLARAKQQNYLAAYGRPDAAGGWHFLTGAADSIEALTRAVGFRYRYLEERREFAHPAVLFVLTPAGRVSRYLYGVQQDPRTLRLSLVEGSAGRVGSAVDKFLLYCYRYDSAQGRYTPVALRIMRVAGALTVLVVGAFLLAFWLREARLKRHA